jgi:hypothetical protein
VSDWERIYEHKYGEIREHNKSLYVKIVDDDGDEVKLIPQEVYHLMRTLQDWLKENGFPHGGIR